MANLMVATTPLISLLRELRDETKTLIKQEVGLAKTELTEKVSTYGRNAAWLAAGGIVAYAGVIVLLVGVGALIGYALERAGLHAMFATFLGLAATGLLVALTGCVFAVRALKAFKGESLAPHRTVHSLQNLAGAEVPASSSIEAPEAPGSKPSSEDLERQVSTTQNMVGERMEELGRRIRPQYMNSVVKGQIRAHPVRSLLVAFGTGLAGALMVGRRFRHARA